MLGVRDMWQSVAGGFTGGGRMRMHAGIRTPGHSRLHWLAFLLDDNDYVVGVLIVGCSWWTDTRIR